MTLAIFEKDVCSPEYSLFDEGTRSILQLHDPQMYTVCDHLLHPKPVKKKWPYAKQVFIICIELFILSSAIPRDPLAADAFLRVLTLDCRL